ncbi:hypothetical protein PLESTB_001257700 [Pleodorina starrii]|uniref:Vacuolar protein sorting-associated protein 13 VPS13 adaptor binding domain-containing protein n=1 Tax=Pleodorina starrii TaxID=330485 RepID=A0A9W6BTD8_9CHLO|nr:hypothetical protein PLESTB_001257700 [Pleodorina starrii]
MLSQTGFIASGLPIDGRKGLYINSPLHFAVKVRVKTRTEYSYTTFHSMEVPGPGLFAKASRPLEASINICPTVELTNSLPYHMEGYLISLNGAGRETEVSATGSASPHAAPKPSTAPTDRPRAATSSGTTGGLQPSESRRLIRSVRRSDSTLLEDIPESDQDRIILVFERSLLPMLNQKAKNLWDARHKHLGSSAPNDKMKCFLLALLRYELRWTAKRNAKEMELLVRTDTEPADRITWQELEAFLEWAKQSIRLVHVQPGDTQCLYLDMHKQLVMCIKVPERKLVCTRPVEVNYSSGTANVGEAELPDFMRLDYIDDAGKGFADVWDKMRSGNHSEAPMNFVKVVNQQFRDLRDTARDTTAAVVNTVRGVRDAAIDVFSGPNSSKLVPASTLADVLGDDTAAYWHQNPDKVVRVQLLIRPGPGSGGETASLGGKRPEGALSAALSSPSDADGHHGRNLAAALSMAAHPGLSSVPVVAGAAEGVKNPSVERPSEPGVSRMATGLPLSSSPVAMAPAEMGTSGQLGGRAASSGLPPTCMVPGYPVSPFATPVTKSAGGTEKGSADIDALSSGNAGALPEQSLSTSPNGVARSDVPSPSLGALPPVRAILGKLRSSMLKFQDSKASSPGRLGGRDGACIISAAVPNLDEHVCIRLSYRPDAAPAQASRTLRLGRGIQAAFNGLASRAKEGIVAVSTPRPSRSSGEAPRPSSELGTVRIRLHVVPATSDAPECVRVQLIVSPTPLLGCMAEAGVAPLHTRRIRGRLRGGDAVDSAGVDTNVASATLRGNQLSASRQSLDNDTDDATAEDHPQAVSTPASGVRTHELPGSPYTPGAKFSCGATSHTNRLRPSFATGAASEASPGSVVVLHSGPISPISVPGGPPTGRRARPTRHPGNSIHRQASIDAGPADHAADSCTASAAAGTRAGANLAGSLALGEDSSGDSTQPTRCDAADAVPSISAHQETAISPAQRPDAFWSVNAAYKCCSSVSTVSGSDLPTRALPSDFQQCNDAPKAVLPAGETYPGEAQLPSVEGAVRSVTSGSPAGANLDVAGRVSEAGSSSAPHPDNRTDAVGPPSAEPEVLGSLLPALLSEGYAQLELLHASGGSPLGRQSRLGRRSSTLRSSLSMRQTPSKPPHLAGSVGISLGARDGVGQSTSNAALEGQSYPDSAVGVAARAHHAASTVGDAPPSTTTADDLLGSPFMALGQAVHASRSPYVTGSNGEVKDATTSGVAGINSSAGAAIPPNPSCHEQHPRRLTADDVISTPRELDGSRCSGDFDSNALEASTSARKVQSEKRIGERVYGFRFRERATLRGIGKKGSEQPSYKYFQARAGRKAPSPIALAKSAIQVVPRLPGIARNVGGKFVDGGQQMIQGVPHVASFVADKVIAGGQGVKEKVVESTGQAIKIAKPKIERGLMSMAWKATEAMRKRKQGTDEVALYEDPSKPPRGAKRRAEVERAPKVLLLSVHNSLARKEDDHVCRLSLYAAYWVDNRTGFNLLFKDLDAPAGLDNLPFLLWHPVQVPGNKADASGFDNPGEQPNSGGGAGMPNPDRNSVPRIDRATAARRAGHAQLPHKPALLNDQARTRFRISHPHYSETDFCVAFTVATTNQKYSVDIKGEKSEAKVARSEIVYSRRPSGHSGFAKAAADTAPKEQPTGTMPLPPLPDHDHAPSSSRPLGAPEGERPTQHQQQAQPDVPRSAGDPDGQTRQQSGLADRVKGLGAGTGVSIEEPTVRAASGALEAEPKQVETQPLPFPTLDPGSFENPSPAAPVVSDCGREGVPHISAMPQGIIFARRPLETVCEITPAEEESEGPSTSVIPTFAPAPLVLQHLHPGRLLEETAADSVLGADAAGEPVPLKPTLSTVAVSLSRQVPLPAVDARTTAGGGSLPPILPNPGGGGRRRKRRFRKGGGTHAVEDGTRGQACQQEPSEIVPVRRLYQFAVEVWGAPSDTVFSRTKIITVKNKYLILNATGLTIEYKQKGTPDPDPTPAKDTGYGKGVRFSRRLDNNSRAAWHWDNVFAEQELMIRPAGDEWDWSGSFKLPELEDYFGLRVRHRQRNDYVIIPVNISVGPAGSVLITLKSIGSVPPYMVINRCRDVVIRLKQADYNRRASSGAWDDWDEISPGSNQIPFAWDEPRLRHVVKVVATVQQGAAPDQASAMDVDLDAVDVNCVIYVQSRSMRTLSLAAQLDARERAKFLTDNAKKVYVTVHADGPTRVLCFSEDRSGVAYLDDENSLLNLSYRLQRVGARLKEVDQKLVQQLGGSLVTVRSARHDLDGPLSGSQGAAGSATSPEEARVPAATRFGSIVGAPRAFGLGMAVGRQGLLQLPAAPVSSGTATPQSARLSAVGPGGQVGQASFAFQRLPSTGPRAGSTYPVSVAPGANRYPSVPSSAAVHFNPMVQRMQQVRASPSSHPHGAGAPKLADLEGPSALSELAPPTGDRLSRPMETLPAFEGYVDLPIGGDLTVILRSVEGLSAALKSNEKLVAVEAKMAVVSSTPDLDGGSSQRRVTASWTQAADAPASITGASGFFDGPGGDGGSGFGFGAGSSPSLGYAGRVTLQDHMEIFRDIAASSELQVDFYIAKGTEQPHASSHAARRKEQQAAAARSASQGQGHVRSASASRSTGNAATTQRLTFSSGQFAGCVRIPLMSTIECDKAQVWRLPLERKTGAQLVRGYVSLSFQWSLTNEGMLVREVATLERILDEKIELLAQLNPLPTSASSAFVRGPAALAGSARQDAPAAVAATSPAAADAVGDEIALSHGAGSAAIPSLARPSPVRKTAKALAESYNVNLELSVLEIAGLLPREGIRASIAASMYGRQTANMMSIAMLPRAAVSMSCNGETRAAAAGSNSVNPRFPKNTAVFQNVPLGSKVLLKVLDQVSGSYHKVLAEAEIHLSHIPGTDPVYAWLALKRRKHGSRSQRVLAMLMVMEEEGDADVQMLIRIKISKPQVHGVALSVTLDLAGIGLCAKTNLEELFNYTMQKIRTSLVQTRTDLQVSLAVQTIQLDNQMLEAKNPVVLSPADVSGSSSLAQARRRHKARLAQRIGPTNSVLRMGGQDSALQNPLLIFQVIYNQASSNHAVVNSKGQEDSVGILAFKKVILELGPMDFSADQEFIEGLVAYLNGIPLEDFYQEEAWQAKIDAMQGGSMTPLGAAAEDLAVLVKQGKGIDALAWLAAKEAKELELLRGQSSMWFYLEEFYLSDVFINVTLALSSSFNAGGSALSSGKEDDRQRSMVRGFLSRVSGSNGFQLINVTNVPIQLEYVELQNHLVNRVSLVNKLYRHYSWIAIAQARKVLGGAGPAIAAIPASLLWAGIALFDLGQDVAAKRVNPLVVPMRMGYVTFTLMGQIVGVMSRTMCAIMGLLPPRFSSDTVNLSDSETARRFGIKPQTVMDALYLSQRDVVLGLMSAAFGVIHDTSAGGRWKGGLVAIGVPMGLLKASVGLGMRPAAGAVEATSKLLQGFGLMCLGKRGIQGKLVRRVQAPGVAVTDVVQAARASAAQAAMQGALIAAWQAALPAISSALADDEVLDVVAARSTRVVLLTNRHLAYLYARRHAASSASASSASRSATSGAFSVTYRVKWIIPNGHIDNIRGLDRGYAVSVEYHKPVKLGRLSLKLPLHKGMRTATAEGHKDLIFRLNRHMGRAASSGEFGVEVAAVPVDSRRGEARGEVNVRDLSIKDVTAR